MAGPESLVPLREHSLRIAARWPMSIPARRILVSETVLSAPRRMLVIPFTWAPEMFHKGAQISKVDVWSLFVTMLRTLNVGEFRQQCNQFKSPEDAREAVAASKIDTVSKIQERAIVKSEKCASAAQMPVKCYNRIGLTTPRTQVPALTRNRFQLPLAEVRPQHLITQHPQPSQLELYNQNRRCKRMEIYLQPLISTLSRKFIVPFKHNPFVGYKTSAENY